MTASTAKLKRQSQLIAVLIPPLVVGLAAGSAGATFYDSEKLTPEFKHWQETQRKGSVAFENNEYGKAERLLKEAVAEAREIGPGDVRIAQSPGDLGRLLSVRARFKEAQPLLEEEFYLKQRAIGDDTAKLIRDMEGLIIFYLTVGTSDRAVPLTEDLLDFVQGKFKEQSAEIAAQNKLEKGGVLVGWAGTAAPASIDPLLEWAITCDKLGDLYRDKGDLPMAGRLYTTALDVKATVLGKKHLSLANSYDNLGGISLKKNELKDSESYYREALDITENVLEKGDPQIYARMNRLAICLIAAGKDSEAEQLYLKAIREWSGGQGGIEQRALYSLACFYSDRRRFGSAAPLLRRGLRLSERNNGSLSVANVPYLRKLGYVLYYCGQKGVGQSYQARANHISPVVRELKAQVKMGKLSLDPATSTARVR